MGDAQPAIVVEDVWKSFPRRRPVGELLRHPFQRADRVEALLGVSLEVRVGEIYGLLGPNGAGKTTLLKTLCGLILPERGRVEVFGIPAGTSRLSRALGLVHGEERSFYWRLTARENLEFYARLHGIPRPGRAEVLERLLEKVDLARDADRRFGDFSTGMRQRLAFARALLADPPVLLMDEPTRSLDPLSADRLRAWIVDRLHGEDGKTILIATHNLREAETICQRVAILARGRVRAAADPASLRRMGIGGAHYRIEVRGELPDDDDRARIVESEELERGRRLLVELASAEDLDAWLRRLHAAGGSLLSCAPEETDLEQAFHRVVLDAAEEGRT